MIRQPGYRETARELRQVAAAMREDHPAGHQRRAMWLAIAELLEDDAEQVEAGWNPRTLRVARAYPMTLRAPLE